MAKNIKEVREPLGVNDEPISINAIEKITVIELGKFKMEAKGTKVKNVKSTELSENMIIGVSNGGYPGKGDIQK